MKNKNVPERPFYYPFIHGPSGLIISGQIYHLVAKLNTCSIKSLSLINGRDVKRGCVLWLIPVLYSLLQHCAVLGILKITAALWLHC